MAIRPGRTLHRGGWAFTIPGKRGKERTSCATYGTAGGDFSRAWRDRQLEYSFRWGLMQQDETFAVCTAQTLDHTCALFGLRLSPEDRRQRLEAYRTLPAFRDISERLARKDSGATLGR